MIHRYLTFTKIQWMASKTAGKRTAVSSLTVSELKVIASLTAFIAFLIFKAKFLQSLHVEPVLIPLGESTLNVRKF